MVKKEDNNRVSGFFKDHGFLVTFIAIIFGFGVTYANILNEIKDIKHIMKSYKVELNKQKSAIFDQQRLNLYSLGKKCAIAEREAKSIKEKQKIDAINNDFVTPRRNYPLEHDHLEKSFISQRKSKTLDKKKSVKRSQKKDTQQPKLFAIDD